MSIFTSHSSFDYWVKNIADEVAKNRRLVSYFVRAHNEFGGIHAGFWGDVYRHTGKPLLVRTYLVKDKTSIGLNMRNAVYSALVVRLGLPVKEAKEYCLEGIIEGVAEANAKALLEMEEACLADVMSVQEKYSIEKACLADLESIAASMGVKSTRSKHENIVNVKVRISPEPSVSKDTETLLEKDKAIFADIVSKSLLDMEKACRADVKDFTNAKKKIEEICYTDLEAIVASMSVKSMSNMKFDTFDDAMRKFSADMGAEVIRSEFTNGPEGKVEAGLPNHKDSDFSKTLTGLGNTGSISTGYTLNDSVNTGSEVYLKQPTKKEAVTMKIERPVNVVSNNFGTVNILSASEHMLASLVREAQKEIDADDDLALISKSYAKKAEELQKIIDMCVKQLDKVAK